MKTKTMFYGRPLTTEILCIDDVMHIYEFKNCSKNHSVIFCVCFYVHFEYLHLPLSNQKLRFHSVSCTHVPHWIDVHWNMIQPHLSLSFSSSLTRFRLFFTFYIAVATFSRLAVIVCDHNDRTFFIQKCHSFIFLWNKMKKKSHRKKFNALNERDYFFLFSSIISILNFGLFVYEFQFERLKSTRKKKLENHNCMKIPKNFDLITFYMYIRRLLVWLSPFNFVSEFYIVQ